MSSTGSTSTPTGTVQPDISYEFRFRTDYQIPDTFLYNTGPIEALNSPNWNRRQFYDVSVVSGSVAADPRYQPGLPAVQHRAAVDAELCRAWPEKPSTTWVTG